MRPPRRWWIDRHRSRGFQKLQKADGVDGKIALQTSSVSHSTATDTSQERADPPFNVRKMAILMEGSERNLVLKEKFSAEVSDMHAALCSRGAG